MEHIQRVGPITPPSRLDEVRQMINDSLWGDWVIRIEHAAPTPGAHARWEQWGEALFPVNDPAPVIAGILRCRSVHATRSIRLCAEKLQPRTKLLFSVYRAGQDDAPIDQPLPGAAALPEATGMRPDPSAGDGRAVAAGRWRYVALAGVLLGSALMIEMAAG